MSSEYARDHCKIAVGKILQTLGWHSINSTPLEVLTDIMSSYIQQISKLTNDYTNEFGQTEANLDHLGLAFQEMGINLSDLEEYVTYVNFTPGPHPAPKFPIPKENHLNFLKPGSKEVVTRPVHIPEHLPPMFPLLEGTEVKNEEIDIVKEEIPEEPTNTTPFKKPADVASPEFRKPKKDDEGSRPTREISSVMMTTSGFLSPAREGKLPEAKAPLPPPPPPPPPAPEPPPVVEPPALGTAPAAPPKKKAERRKEKLSKELFKPLPEDKPVKKPASMKDPTRPKKHTLPPSVSLSPIPLLVPPNAPNRLGEMKVRAMPLPKMMRDNLMDKALAAAKAKTEKLNTTITPIPMRFQSPGNQVVQLPVEKLFNEPDRKKINILRKISSVKEGKKKESRAGTPSLVIEEPSPSDIVTKISMSSDITIEPIMFSRSPDKIDGYFDNGSPPGTPPTPRTPEIVTHSPPIQKEKRKRKEPKNKPKRPRKQRPFLTESELVDIIMDRPKTPDAHHLSQMRGQLPPHMGMPPMPSHHVPFPFLAHFGGPGLIPPQLSTPLFPFAHLGGLPNFGKNPYFNPVMSNMPQQVEPMPLLSPKVKDLPPVEVKPVDTPKPPVRPPLDTPPKAVDTPPKAIDTPPKPALPSPPVAVVQPIQVAEASSSTGSGPVSCKTPDIVEIGPKKLKEHKKEKKDKKKNKKDKVKEKGEKKTKKEMKKDAKELKDKLKKEKKIKKKDKLLEKEHLATTTTAADNPAIPKILLKVNSPSPRPGTPEAARKLTIKPVVKRDDPPPGPPVAQLPVPEAEERRREPSPGGLAKIAALVTGPPKPRAGVSPVPPAVEKVEPESSAAPAPTTPKTPSRAKAIPAKPKSTPKAKKIEQVFKKMDEQGNEVWICPACGQQDDGRPMIGCDGCDAWYHWVCVGIQVPPDENENWYCKPCLCRKNEQVQGQDKRNKKRKRKEKKDH
ncbi:unnamed protein product [Phaedon cochleariae]|uniref:PHD-type domain-containing protein n=1 Tax=Phaedon cochleariae TaxID=80249 RepID=A0A9N9X4Q9_PHACE|nr:unnamed protein product [Phaedon cochleariae]